MRLSWLRCYIKELFRNLRSVKAVNAVLGSFGVLWLIVEWTNYFFPTVVVFGTTTLPDAIRHCWLYFLLAGLLFAFWQCKPRMAIVHKLKGRDVSIEIAVGDIFSLPGEVIVGSNTTFDTRAAVISERSVQGLFTNKYYRDHTQLEAELSVNLKSVSFEELAGGRVGNSKAYPMGTCVTLRPKERTGYLIAIAKINEHGAASGTFEDLKNSFAKLWEYIGTRGSKEPLLIPVLGTGFSRLPQAREEIVREIIKSFIAACTERTFTDKLTIVITPEDLVKNNISLEQLGAFLQFQCDYAIVNGDGRTAVGTAI